MDNPKNITIAVLSISAVILGMLVLYTYNAEPAYGSGMAARADTYIMASGSASSSKDVIYVINVPKQQLNLYVLNNNTNVIELPAALDLSKEFGG